MKCHQIHEHLNWQLKIQMKIMLSKNLLSWIYREFYEWYHKQFFGTVESYTPEVEDHSFSLLYPFADVHLKSNAHDQARSRYFWKGYLYLLACPENTRP